MKPWQIERLKELFPADTRIELISMEGEPDMPKGLQGKVDMVDGIGQIHISWDNGRMLAINPDVDQYLKISQEETNRHTTTCDEEDSISYNEAPNMQY